MVLLFTLEKLCIPTYNKVYEFERPKINSADIDEIRRRRREVTSSRWVFFFLTLIEFRLFEFSDFTFCSFYFLFWTL